MKLVILAGISTLAETALGKTLVWKPIGHIPEFECKCGCGQCRMDRGFMIKFQQMRKEWIELTNTDLVPLISSGYRCENHPVEKRKLNGGGPHTKGKAVDIKVSGKKATLLFKLSKKYMTGIGVSQRSRKKKHHYIHMDCLSSSEARRPTVWRYS